MDDPIADYVAKRVVEDIRAGRRIEDKLAGDLVQMRWTAALRRHVGAADVPFVLEMARCALAGVRSLGISLLKSVRNDPQVRTYLWDTWLGQDSFDTRFRVMMRLLDYDDLTEQQHEELHAAIRDNWAAFLHLVVAYYGGSDSVLSWVKERLGQNEGKAHSWLYLCCAMASSDGQAVRGLLREHMESRVPVVRKTATELLTGFDDRWRQQLLS